MDIDYAERLAMSEETQMSLTLAKAVSFIRKLQHELNDPNYRYVGRIHRQAILSRNAQIERLLEENAKLREAVTVEIIVNGKKVRVQPKPISFEEVLDLADWKKGVHASMTCSHGQNGGTIMEPGKRIEIKGGEKFSVANTGSA